MTSLLRSVRSQLPIIAIAAVFAVMLLYLASERGAKLMLVAAGVILGGGGALLSGNLRLFCLWGLILSMPFDLSYRLGPVFAKLGGETSFRLELSDLFWLALLAYQARDLSSGVQRGLRIPKVTYLWIAIGMMGMASVVMGPWRLTAMHEVARMVKIMMIFIVLCNELRTPGRIMQVAVAIAVAILIQAVAGITQYLTGAAFGLPLLGEADVTAADNVVKSHTVTRVGAFMLHPVIFGTFLATLLPVAVGLVLIRCGSLRRTIFAATILLGVPALVLTLSRAGWLTFAVTSSIMVGLIMFRPALRRKALIPLAGAVIVIIGVAGVFSGQIAARIWESNTESAKVREEWAGDAVRLAAVKPVLGWGLNSYAFAAPPYTRLGERGAREFYEKARFGFTKLIPVVHNAYLQWLAEIGYVGFALHLSIFVVLIYMGLRNLRVRDEFLFVLNAACTAGIVGYLVDLNFGNSLRQGSTLREFWVLAALVCTIHYWRLRNEAPAAARASSMPSFHRGAGPVPG
jgi:O-antigen ligase